MFRMPLPMLQWMEYRHIARGTFLKRYLGLIRTLKRSCTLASSRYSLQYLSLIHGSATRCMLSGALFRVFTVYCFHIQNRTH